MINNGRCDKRLIWNPINCECECDKLCDVEEYLGYINCNCRKRLIDELVEECSENIDGNEIIYNSTINDYEKICSPCTVYIALFVIFSIISISISSVYICFH